jgi:hypothetical protein
MAVVGTKAIINCYCELFTVNTLIVIPYFFTHNLIS